MKVTRPAIVSVDDPALPYSQQAALRNQIANLRLVHCVDWLKEADLSTVIEMWWHAQTLKAQELEVRRQQDAARTEYNRQRARLGEGEAGT